jgi:hypothetical protein
MVTTKEDYFKAKYEYTESTWLSNEAIKKNVKAITETIKKLYIYTGIKENMTGSECKLKIEAECILNKMLENLSLDSISVEDFLIKMLENCNLISVVIKAIETETETESNVYLTKIVILNKMLNNIDLTLTIMKLTDSKSEAVSKVVLTKMLVNLKSISTTTYKSKLAEQKAKYHADFTRSRFYFNLF